MLRKDAETVALRALGYIAGQEGLITAFLNASGAGVANLGDQAGDPDFLASVLDFLLMDDAWVIGFCDAEGLPYGLPLAARAALPGGAAVHWT